MISTSGSCIRKRGCCCASISAPHVAGIRLRTPIAPRVPPPKTLAPLAAAHFAGSSIGALCDHMHQHEGISAPRRILGVLAVAKKHGPAVVENAAHTAIELGFPTYRFLRRYLERQPPLALTLRQVDPLIGNSPSTAISSDRATGTTGDSP